MKLGSLAEISPHASMTTFLLVFPSWLPTCSKTECEGPSVKDQDAHCWWALLCSKPNQSQSEGNQRAIRGQSEGNQRAIRGQSEPIRGQSEGNQRAIRAHQRAIRCHHQGQSEAIIRANQRPSSEPIRGQKRAHRSPSSEPIGAHHQSPSEPIIRAHRSPLSEPIGAQHLVPPRWSSQRPFP